MGLFFKSKEKNSGKHSIAKVHDMLLYFCFFWEAKTSSPDHGITWLSSFHPALKPQPSCAVHIIIKKLINIYKQVNIQEKNKQEAHTYITLVLT